MEDKIPKIIHYVWLGGKAKPESVQKCINSWKKFCPDYEIKEWNENTFNCDSVLYVKEALQCRKFAFASDFIRLYALYTEGGLYMDTDVEVVKPLDRFLSHRAFSGFENQVWIPTAVMGGEKNHPWYKLLLDYYDNKHFIINGKPNTMTNVDIIGAQTRLFYNVKINDETQHLKDGLVLYSHDYFCPKNYVTEKIESTENTHAIHHFAGSWQSKKDKRNNRIVKNIRRIFGEKIFEKIKFKFLKIHSNKAYKIIKKMYKTQQKIK